ncbi:hypothetical protein AAVH_35875, partial [Aphelenchoides avenae]
EHCLVTANGRRRRGAALAVQRTGCVGDMWTKRAYQYLIYSPDLEGRDPFIQ